MKTMTRLALFASLACAACAREEPPQADPADVERVLARLEAQDDSGARIEETLGPKAKAKAEQADRLVPTLSRVPVEKIDPSVAASLLAS
jgi:hypothetical protein